MEILTEKYLLLDSLIYQLVITPEKEMALLAIPEISADRIIMLYYSSLFTEHQCVIKTFKDYFQMLNKRLQYLHKLLQDFRSKRLAMINKAKNSFQYNSGDLVYLISLLTNQLHTTSRKVAIKYVGPLVIYTIIDPHNYLLMT